MVAERRTRRSEVVSSSQQYARAMAGSTALPGETEFERIQSEAEMSDTVIHHDTANGNTEEDLGYWSTTDSKDILTVDGSDVKSSLNHQSTPGSAEASGSDAKSALGHHRTTTPKPSRHGNHKTHSDTTESEIEQLKSSTPMKKEGRSPKG